MIGKDYFKRQATTLRKMVRVTKNPSIADRLSLMVEDFDARSARDNDELDHEARPLAHAANREDRRD